jgi:hypothetical protein
LAPKSSVRPLVRRKSPANSSRATRDRRAVACPGRRSNLVNPALFRRLSRNAPFLRWRVLDVVHLAGVPGTGKCVLHRGAARPVCARRLRHVAGTADQRTRSQSPRAGTSPRELRVLLRPTGTDRQRRAESLDKTSPQGKPVQSRECGSTPSPDREIGEEDIGEGTSALQRPLLIKITVFEKRAKTHLGGFWPVRTFTNACFLCEFVKAKRPLGQSPSLCLVVDDFRKKVWERNTEQIEGWKGRSLIV